MLLSYDFHNSEAIASSFIKPLVFKFLNTTAMLVQVALLFDFSTLIFFANLLFIIDTISTPVLSYACLFVVFAPLAPAQQSLLRQSIGMRCVDERPNENAHSGGGLGVMADIKGG